MSVCVADLDCSLDRSLISRYCYDGVSHVPIHFELAVDIIALKDDRTNNNKLIIYLKLVSHRAMSQKLHSTPAT